MSMKKIATQDDGITHLTATESRKLWKLLEETPEEAVEQNYRRLMAKGLKVGVVRPTKAVFSPHPSERAQKPVRNP